MEYSLNTRIENSSTRYLLYDNEQNYYSINKLLYDILFEYKHTQSNKEICDNLNRQRTENLLTEDFVHHSLEKAKEIIFKPTEATTDNKKYIKHKITIIKEGQFQKVYKLLSLSFNKYIFTSLSVISIFISIQFFYKHGFTNLNQLYNGLLLSSSITNLAIAFLLFFLIILLHEIGHAAATFKFKITPKEIGAGVYFIFPVLFTNVTNIWNLPASKRLLVNVAGIYFQLIINIFLIFLYRFNFFNNIIVLLLVFNTISVLVSFNPFFRYDGYWIFSDFFGIYNLKEKSNTFIKTAIKSPSKIKLSLRSNNTNTKLAIIIYAILNIFFWGWVYFSVTEYIIKNVPRIISLIFIKTEFSLQSVSTLFSCFLILIWLTTAVKTIYINILKHHHHAKQ